MKESTDVSIQELDRNVIKEFKLYFNLLINSFNNNDLSRECDYMGRLSTLIATLESYPKLPTSLKEMMRKVKDIQNHIENMQEIEMLNPEIKRIQETLDKMG
jgi:hypothetical protein